jgi:PRTRC genetic system protein E
MFKELKPLLSKRGLVLTVNATGEDRIRVTITPRSATKDENKELVQPLAVEGTADEFDNELSATLVSYTAEHLTLTRALEQVKSNMDSALKEAKEEAAKKIAEAKKGSAKTSAKPLTPAPEVKKEEPAPSLFDVPGSASVQPDAASKPTPIDDTEDDDDDEDDEDDKEKDTPPPLVKPEDATSGATASAQPSMFDVHNEEDEILQEAFYGSKDNHVAA